MDVKKLLLGLNEKPIAYYPIYRKITGSTTTGILLSQLLYWWSATGGRKFYKQDSEIMEESGLTVNELRSSKAILKKLDFVIISVEGIPAKTNYDFDADLLANAICSFHDTPPTKQVSLNSRNYVSEIHETVLVDSTKLYTENTQRIPKEGEKFSPIPPHSDSPTVVFTIPLEEKKEKTPPTPPRLTAEQKAAAKAEKKEKDKNDFGKKLVPFMNEYGKEMIRAFFDYWTEASQTGKMRFQDQRFFEVGKRLATWKRKDEQYKEKNNRSATTGLPTNGGELATKENTPPHTHPHFDLLQRVLAQYPNTLNYARWFTVEEMERWGAERPTFCPVLHERWQHRYMEDRIGKALRELEGHQFRKQNGEKGLFAYLVGWIDENFE